MKQKRIHSIPAADWYRWRVKIRNLLRIRDERPSERPPPGWSVSPKDPAGALRALPGLRLKPAMLLVAFQYYHDGNGHGLVWAIPAESRIPDPCDARNASARCPRKPSGALDDFMEAIDGDGSPSSYAMASLLVRQLHEFGAFWHGLSWDTHDLVFNDPWFPGGTDRINGDPPSPREHWKWKVAPPGDWRPQVVEEDHQVHVLFHTYTALGKETLIRHHDVYQPGSYVPQFQEPKIVAIGERGYVF